MQPTIHRFRRAVHRRCRVPVLPLLFGLLLATAALVVVVVGASPVRAAPLYEAAASSAGSFAGSVSDLLNSIRNWIMGILAGLATLFMTIGGVRYVIAGGDPGEVEKAKTAFKSAAIGYGLAALAPLIVAVLKGMIGA